MIRILLVLFSFLLLSRVYSQEHHNYLEAGVGLTSYKGDLQPTYDGARALFHLGYKLNKAKRINGRFNLDFGSFVGENTRYEFTQEAEANDLTPKRYFKTRFASVYYEANFNVIKNEHWIVYLSQGIGVMRFEVLDSENNSLADQTDTRLRDEEYGFLSFVFPSSVGFNYIFDNNYGFGAHFGWVLPSSDYLDNLSGLSTSSSRDNLLQFKFSVLIPIYTGTIQDSDADS